MPISILHVHRRPLNKSQTTLLMIFVIIMIRAFLILAAIQVSSIWYFNVKENSNIFYIYIYSMYELNLYLFTIGHWLALQFFNILHMDQKSFANLSKTTKDAPFHHASSINHTQTLTRLGWLWSSSTHVLACDDYQAFDHCEIPMIVLAA